MIRMATEIKVRAERRCGEMLRESAKNGERATPKTANPSGLPSSNDTTRVTLSDIGLTRDESSRYQKLAAMPEEYFETAIATAGTNLVNGAELLTRAGLHEGGAGLSKKFPTAAQSPRLG